MLKTYKIRGEKRKLKVYGPKALLKMPRRTSIVIENVHDGYSHGTFIGFEFPPPSANCPLEEMPDVIVRYFPVGNQIYCSFDSIKYVAPFTD